VTPPRLNGTMHHEPDNIAGIPSREFWIGMRRGLLVQLEAIEKEHLPDKHAESLAARRWLEETRQQRQRVEST